MAVRPYLASQPLDETTANRETQPAPAERLATEASDCMKGSKIASSLSAANADAGVENLKTQPDAVGVVVARR